MATPESYKMFELKVLSLDINLQLQIVNGELEAVWYQPIVKNPKITENVTIDQNCPHCYKSFSLNIHLNQLKEEDNSVSSIKEEAVEFVPLEIECDIKSESAEEDSLNVDEDTDRERQSVKGPKVYKCENCGITSKKGLKAHKEICYAPDYPIICYQCPNKEVFVRMDEFFKHTKAKHKRFLCSICDPPRSYEYPHKWRTHMKLVHANDGNKCTRCDKIFKSKVDYFDHIRDYFKGGMFCKLCNNSKEYQRKSIFFEHFKEVHGAEAAFPCPFCDSSSATEAGIIQHMADEHWKIKFFSCSFCKDRFFTREERKHHNGICKGKPIGGELFCNHCTFKCTSRTGLLIHFTRSHNLGPAQEYICHICGKSTTSKDSQRKHIKSHTTPEAPYECDYCKKKFHSKCSVTNHILAFHYPKDLCHCSCEICGSRYATEELLNRHMKSHKRKKGQAKCDLCFKGFPDQKALVGHRSRMHTAKGRSLTFCCDLCNFVTSKDDYLRKHKLQHLSDAEKPFQCKICGKGFINKHLCLRHEWSHSDTRPYNCDVCGRGFRTPSDMACHKRLHTGEKPYECQVCQKRFADRGCFRSHLVKHEKELNITLDKSIKKKPIIIGVDVKPGPSLGGTFN